MPESNLIDTGAKSVGLAFDMGVLGPNETKSFHITGEHLLGGLPVKDHDLFNAKTITTKVQGPVRCGVTYHHDADCEMPIATGSRVIHVNSATGDANAYHHLSGAMTSLHLHDYYDSPVGENVIKRCAPKWQGMTTANIDDGIFKITKTNADGAISTKYVATPTATKMQSDNSANAIHTLISSNESNSKFLGGKFASPKNKMVFNGHDSYVLEPADYNQLSSQLKGALSQESPFKHGLCCTVTNLTNVKGSDSTIIHCDIGRHDTVAKLEGAGSQSFDSTAAGPTQANAEVGKSVFGSSVKADDKFEVESC